jgi:high-affinity K+ transport system ATPase subunit B
MSRQHTTISPDRPPDAPPSSVKRLGLSALMRHPVLLTVAIGAVWTSAMVAGGDTAMAPVTGWLWLTVLFTAHRTVTRQRPASPRAGSDRQPAA